MNTPTPAQALGEVLKLIASNPEGVHKIHAEQVALRLLEQHGQHFAGLEKKAADLREFKRYADEANETLKTMCQAWTAIAEAAEARCAELEAGCQMLREEVEGLRSAFLAANGETK